MGARKVAAYIIRRSASGHEELLVFAHRDMRHVPIQVPAGTIEDGEEIAHALFREIGEESGLVNLTIVRKLGVHQFIWEDSGHPGERHFFLLRAASDTPNTWDHAVQGGGLDDGLVFSYSWVRVTDGFRLEGDIGKFLTSTHVPELYISREGDPMISTNEAIP